MQENGLSLFFGVLFLLALAGQSVAGWLEFNHLQAADGTARASYPEYLSTVDFWSDIAENWQSEYLQFLLFIWVTVYLMQKGLPESK